MLNVNTACCGANCPRYYGQDFDDFLSEYGEWKKVIAVKEFCLDHFTKKEEEIVLESNLFLDLARIQRYNFDENLCKSELSEESSENEFDETTAEELYQSKMYRQYCKLYSTFSESIKTKLNKYNKICSVIELRRIREKEYDEECSRIDEKEEITTKKEAEVIYENLKNEDRNRFKQLNDQSNSKILNCLNNLCSFFKLTSCTSLVVSSVFCFKYPFFITFCVTYPISCIYFLYIRFIVLSELEKG